MTVATEALSSLEVVRTMPHPAPRTFTVYFIRHGEAVHNVEEKAAKKRVLKECADRGADEKETKRLAEDARKEVLLDPQFFDASITNLGRNEAQGARDKLQSYVAQGLPAPQEVMVSPLQRCLSTVEEVFSGDEAVKVRVEEDLRERLTGRPADNRMSSDNLEERFPRFSFASLRSISNSNLLSMAESDISDASSTGGLTAGGDDHSEHLSRDLSFDMSNLSNSNPPSPAHPHSSRRTSSSSSALRSSSTNVQVEVEDDAALRKRAFRFFKLLGESESDSVAVVTHKGFLRGLERGCFGIAGSPEFKNCEVRVYKIEMTPGNLFMDGVERLR